MRRRAILCLPLLALAACAEDPIPVAGEPGADTCGAAEVQPLIGQPISRYEAPEGKSVRIIRPGDAVSMDYRPDRLNISLDETDRIVAVDCV